MQAEQVEPIHVVKWAGRFELLNAPSLSSITNAALAELNPRWRDPDADDVLIFPGDVRYLVGGEVPGQPGCRYLHRLP